MDATPSLQPGLLRLAAAAALETHAGYAPVEAWRLSACLPTQVRIALAEVAAIPITTQARREVLRVIVEYHAQQKRQQVRSYPLFAEPTLCPAPAPPAERSGG